MKVSLVNARRSEKPVIPLGLLYIAAVLEKNGYAVRVHDLIFPEDEARYLRDMADYQPDIIGLSFLTTAVLKAAALVRALRSTSSKSIITAGGPHVSGLPKESMDLLGLDYGVAGEGEMPFLSLCEALNCNTDPRSIGGLVYRDGTRVVANPIAGFIENLDELPLPAWHLVNMGNYLFPPGYIKGLFYRRTMPVMTSRGCPSKCIFCSSPNVFGRKIRRRSVGSVISEIKALKQRYDIDGIFFLDDTFTVGTPWVMNLCDALISEKIGLPWSCQTRVNVVTRELLEKMKRAGCVQVDYGIESGSDRILKILKKGITLEQIRAAFKMAEEVGLRTYGSVLIGNPGETMADIEESRKLIREVRPSLTLYNFLTPFPGSELYNNARAYRVNINDREKLYCYDTRTADQPIMSSELSAAEMRQARSKLQNEVFFRNYRGYLRMRNVPFLFEIALFAAKNPRKVMSGLWKTMKNRTLDDLADTMYYIYCKERMSKD
jgi:anaerobic magnesium-protoporphyrin IX monomethyl ester cyclase